MEQSATHVADTHGEVAIHEDHDDHNSPEHIRKEIRTYLTIFFVLGTLTAVTVGVSYIEIPVSERIILALAIASVKGFLVAGYFMHLLSEKKLIYSVLLFTVFFFLVLLWGPWHNYLDSFGRP